MHKYCLLKRKYTHICEALNTRVLTLFSFNFPNTFISLELIPQARGVIASAI